RSPVAAPSTAARPRARSVPCSTPSGALATPVARSRGSTDPSPTPAELPVVAAVSLMTSVLSVGFVGVLRDRHDGDTLGQVHQLHTHCVPVPGPPYGLHWSPDDAPVAGDREELVLWADHHGADQRSTPLRDLRGHDPLATAALDRVLLDRRALSVPAAGGDQHVHAIPDHLHGQQLVVVAEPHPYDTRSGPSHGPQRLIRGPEPDGLRLLADQQQVVVLPDELRPDHLVTFAQVDGDDAAGAAGVELRQGGLLHQALPGGQDQVRGDIVAGDLDHL